MTSVWKKFSLNNNVNAVVLGQIYLSMLSSFLRIGEQYLPTCEAWRKILSLNSSEWWQHWPIHPPQNYRIPSWITLISFVMIIFLRPWKWAGVKRLGKENKKIISTVVSYHPTLQLYNLSCPQCHCQTSRLKKIADLSRLDSRHGQSSIVQRLTLNYPVWFFSIPKEMGMICKSKVQIFCVGHKIWKKKKHEIWNHLISTAAIR